MFVIVRVGSTHSLESLSAILLEEIASRYEGLEVRESNTDGTIFDRSVSFRVGSIEIFQYQRLFLLGSGWPEVNWLVQAQASGPIGQEVDLRPVFSPILSSLRVTLDPGEPRVDRISSAGQTLLS